MVNGHRVLADGTLDSHPCSCHSRRAGMTCINHWIPAFAGMTEGLRLGCYYARVCQDDAQPCFLFVVIYGHAYKDAGGPAPE